MHFLHNNIIVVIFPRISWFINVTVDDYSKLVVKFISYLSKFLEIFHIFRIIDGNLHIYRQRHLKLPQNARQNGIAVPWNLVANVEQGFSFTLPNTGHSVSCSRQSWNGRDRNIQRNLSSMTDFSLFVVQSIYCYLYCIHLFLAHSCIEWYLSHVLIVYFSINIFMTDFQYGTPF